MASPTQRGHDSSGEKSAGGRLDSWKEIATYLGRSERTVRRWEQTTGLPVHRLPQKRASVYAFRSELDGWWESHGSGLTAEPSLASRAKTSSRLKIGWIALAIGLTCLGVVARIVLRRASPPVRKASFTQMTFHAGKTAFPAVSRDGKLLAFVSDRSENKQYDLWVQPLAGGQARQVTHLGGMSRHLDFSPDGSLLAFRSEMDGGGIYSVPAEGGEIRKLAGRGYHPRYSPDGRWLSTSVGVLPAAGGESRNVAPELEIIGGPPLWSKDGTKLLFLGAPAAGRRAPADIDWWIVSLDGGRPVRTGASAALERQGLGPLGENIFPADWDDESAIFSMRFGEAVNIWRIPVSAKTMHVTGPAEQVTFGAANSTPRFMPGGRLLFVNNSEATHIWSLRLNSNSGRSQGEPQPLTRDASLAPELRGVYPRLAANGRKMVFVSHRGGAAAIWQKDMESGGESELHASPRPDERTLISADGSRVAFSHTAGAERAIYLLNLSGEAPLKICASCGVLMDWSADGRRILFGAGNRQGISLLTVDDGRVSELARDPQRPLRNAAFSPDGGWLAWETGDDVVLGRFLNQRQLDIKGAIRVARLVDSEGYPQWSPDGSLLYFDSKHNGYRCVWAQRLDPATKTPQGEPFGVWHLHESQRKIWTFARFSVSRDHLVVPLTEGITNIWMAEWR